MKKLYTLSFLLLTLVTFSQSFTATYDFVGIVAIAPAAPSNGLVDPTPVPTATGVTFGGFSANISSTVVTPPLGSTGIGRFSYLNQPGGAVTGDNVYANLTGTLDPTVNFAVTITPQAGNSTTLSQISFRTQRSGTGIRTYAVRSSADNFAANLQASVSPANVELAVQPNNIFYRVLDATTSGQNGSMITLSGASFTDFTSPITFKFYGWNSEANGGSFSIDDVVFTGSTSSLAIKQNEISGLDIFPNPVTGNILNIQTAANATKTVNVYDVLGKQVINVTTNNSTINVGNLNVGIYIVKVTEEGKTATRKLIVR